ncbi:MAG: GNAT family N-acetyltransferase [Kineosporiaceae bacterium]
MRVTPLSQELTPQVYALMGLGEPYVRVRRHSDYWLYAHLFSSTCPVALVGGDLAGAVIAFRSQDDPEDVHIQDVMVHPAHRRKGVARALVAAVRDRAAAWGCRRLHLTSEPGNTAAHASWPSMGFVNTPGDRVVNGVAVTADTKGPGKDRGVYELELR